MPTPPGQPVVDCTIELIGVQPRVWRRLLVPGSVRLDKLHRMFQAAMGWEDYHLHAFEIGGVRYGMQFDEYPDGELQEKDVTVITAIGANEWFTYDYDFGDSWEHQVTVHRVWRMAKGLKFAVCLEGANACPPEDVGGSWGYEHLLEVLADPSHEEHEDLSEWVGGPFDRAAFDLALVNARLQAIR
jgi:hypothetical protein